MCPSSLDANEAQELASPPPPYPGPPSYEAYTPTSATPSPELPITYAHFKPLPCLEHYTFPRIYSPANGFELSPSNKDVRDAMALLDDSRPLIVQRSEDLLDLLKGSMPEINMHQEGCHHVDHEQTPLGAPSSRTRMAQDFIAEQVATNHEICQQNAQGEYRTEGELAEAWLAVLAEPVNKLSEYSAPYTRVARPSARWIAGESDTIWITKDHPHQSPPSARVKWGRESPRQPCQSPSPTRACLKWSMGSSRRDLEGLVHWADIPPFEYKLEISVIDGELCNSGPDPMPTASLQTAVLVSSVARCYAYQID